MPNENTTNVKFSRGQAANLPEVEDGQIVFTTDTGKLYVDNGTNRTLINDDIPSIPAASTTTPVAIATSAAIGTSTNYARADHKHKIALATGDNNGQVKIAGSNVTVKGLSDAAYKGVASSISSTETGLVTGQQVYNYIDNATSGITGAMHFAGVATSAVTDGGTEDPGIAGYSIKTAGDVVLYSDQEFVWTGVYWEELGNEGSHALKTVKISAGTGLSGGGTLAADRTLSLKTASSGEVGGIKTGYTTSGKNYKVNVDTNGNAYVNVPWTDNNDNTTYTFAEGSTNGAFSVTPSGGSAQSVKVHGLAAAAYKGIETNNSSDTSGLVTLNKVNALIASGSTDTKVTQTLYSEDYNLPLLMSYKSKDNTTEVDYTGTVFRNNSIYANPSAGAIYATSFYGGGAISNRISATKGTAPSSGLWFDAHSGRVFQTGTGTELKDRVNYIEGTVDTNKNNQLLLEAYDWTTNGTTSSRLIITGAGGTEGGNITANVPFRITNGLQMGTTSTVNGSAINFYSKASSSTSTRYIWMGYANGANSFYLWDSTNSKSIITSTAAGVNTFNGTANQAEIVYTSSTAIKGTNPSAEVWKNPLTVLDGSGAGGTAGSLMRIQNRVTADGWNCGYFRVFNYDAANTEYNSQLALYGKAKDGSAGYASFNVPVHATNFIGNWNGIAIGSGTTTYLRNDGTWATPAGDHKVTQTLYSENYNLPLLMSYKTTGNTTTNVVETTFRNNSIYANPSTGTIYAKFFGEGYIYNRLSVAKGTAPSTDIWYDANSGRVFQSGVGSAAVDRAAYIEGWLDPNKNNNLQLNAYDWTSGSSASARLTITGGGGTIGSRISSNVPIYGAVFNDYAEYREVKEEIEPGRCVIETGHGDLTLCNKRLAPGAEIVSDTYGFAIGQTEKYNTPIASSGRVLAYTYEDRDEFKPGDAVCSGPNGTISRMTREEIREWPDRIIGTVSEIPEYEIWQAGDVKENPINVKVNGRIWIRIR